MSLALCDSSSRLLAQLRGFQLEVGFRAVSPFDFGRLPGDAYGRVNGSCPAASVSSPENTVTRAAMLKAEYRSRSKSMRSPEHPCPQQQSVRVPGPYGHQRIHAQSIISLMFQDHTIPRASMPKHIIVCVPRAYGVCALKRPL